MAIDLAIPLTYLPRTDKWWGRKIGLQLAQLFVKRSINIPNITMEKGESLIMHSEAGIGMSVAVRCEKDTGRMRVFFAPPATDVRWIELSEGEIGFSPDWIFGGDGKVGE